MKEPAVEIKDLSISIGGARILEAVSFSVDEREYLSIIGPNGAGKTTILKCLMRIYPNWTGTVKVAGIPLDAMSQKELAGRISYVPQSEGRSVPFTVGEMVVMGRYPHLSPFTSIKPVDREAVEQALEQAVSWRPEGFKPLLFLAGTDNIHFKVWNRLYDLWNCFNQYIYPF